MKLTPDQLVEIAKLIAEVMKDTNPKVHRLIKNCCINADYVQIWTPKETYKSSQIVTPNQFIKMCYEAGVDFSITGQQLYYQYTNRDLADTIRMTERLKKFGKPIQITEIGTTSGPTKETVESGKYEIPNRPYSWHREWDQDLQADWLEQIYTIMYSKQWIEAINWYDFVDPYSFIQNGGLLANPEGEKKEAYPVYTGRAMGALLDMVRTGRIARGETILFWHTGGAPALCAYSRELSVTGARAARAPDSQ